MKRMNVREFRKNIAHLSEEPIEVVRYSETIGFWTPISMTTEPRKKPKVVIKPTYSAEDLEELVHKISIAAAKVKEIKGK